MNLHPQNILYGQKDGTIADITEAKKDPLYFYDTDWESPREGDVYVYLADILSAFCIPMGCEGTF